MATRSEAEIDRRLAPTAAEYVDEEHAAAEEESRREAAASAGKHSRPWPRACWGTAVSGRAAV